VSGALPTTFYESVGGGAAASDLDGDRRTEVVVGTLAGKLYVWGQDGKRRHGFPVRTEPRFSTRAARDRFNRLQPGLLAAPSLADLDGDGRLEIVAAAMDRHVYVWRADGSPQPGWPVHVIDRTQMASIDPVTHHVVPKTVGGQSVALQGTKIVSSPAVGALLGDGKPVVVVGSNEEYREPSNFSSVGNSSIGTFQGLGLLDRANGRVHAIPARGNDDPAGAGNPAGPELPGWPVRIGVLAAELLPWIEGVPGSPALADVDGDGRLEVGIFGVVGPAYILRADGTSFYGTGPDNLPITLPTDGTTFGPDTITTDAPSVPGLGSGTFAPIGPGGAIVYAAPGAGFGRLADTNVPAQQLPHDSHLAAWNAATGEFLPGFPRLLDDIVFFGSAAIADVSGDGQAEMVIGSGGYLVHAMDATGTEAPGWPKFTGGWIIATPALGRLGTRPVVAVTTREAKLWVWRVRSDPDARFWPQARHDATNSGVLR
jgi:hypothetical protein